MTARRRLLLSLLAVVAVLLGACSGPDHPSTPEGAGPIEASSGPGQLSDLGPLPFDELTGTGAGPEEQLERWRAYSAGYPDALTRCMRTRGYTEFVEPAAPLPTLEELERSASSIGTASDGLRDHGYGIAASARLQIDNASTDRSSEAHEVPAWITAMTEPEHRAYATDHGSCQGQALERFPHPNGGFVATVGNAKMEAYFELAALQRSFAEAPEVREIWAEWSECLRGRGRSARHRTDLIASLNEIGDPIIDAVGDAQRADPGTVLAHHHPTIVSARAALAELEEREAEMVADDLACAEPMDLDRREHAALHRLQTEHLAEHGDEVRRLVATAGLGR